MKHKTIRRMTLSVLILLGITLGVVLFLNGPSFGRLPRGERLERIRRSQNFRDGEFRNREATPQLTSDKSRMATMLGFLFRKQTDLRPDHPVAAVHTDLKSLDPSRDAVVWFGHSSYLIQTGGKRVLVDPVFLTAAPVAFVNEPFTGADIFKPEDMPPVDYLVITHDHWDHLDYRTVTELKNRIGTVVCPLGVGEHFERWGFEPARIVEMDWDETTPLADGFEIVCLPARHFSGRGLRANRTLWASFLLQTPSKRIFIGGDSGYGAHFAQIGERFPGIDLAVLENGQYNEDWKYIHTLPELLPRAVADLGARRVLTVHHSKYALARHRWEEPVENARRLAMSDSVRVLIPLIGEVIDLNNN